MHTTAKKSAATILLLAATSLGVTAVSATTSSSAPATAATTSEHTALTPEQQQIVQAHALAQNGRQALSYIVAARQLLSEQHGDEAHQYLEQAKELLTKLESDIIAEDNNTSDLLPIYTQLGVDEEVVITDQIKQQLGKTHLDAISGNHKKVVTALKTVAIELQYSYVDMPVTATLEKVESALTSLSEKNIQQASQALTAAQDGLI
ncbi:MAG TPA: YfdX family protein, partial [Gammaproteobacteria bacterium]|nr:YfdX family protein [Gammaproteobacteria bacterium]